MKALGFVPVIALAALSLAAPARAHERGYGGQGRYQQRYYSQGRYGGHGHGGRHYYSYGHRHYAPSYGYGYGGYGGSYGYPAYPAYPGYDYGYGYAPPPPPPRYCRPRPHVGVYFRF